MSQSRQPPKAVRGNIEAVVRLEEEDERARSPMERLSERMGRLVGTLGFIIAHVVAMAAWFSINSGIVPGIPPFDPFPFPFLAAALSLEGVLLTSFVLIRQERMGEKADRRNHLDLQINLLSEKELTKVIAMLEAVSKRLGIEAEAVDEETRELGEATAVEDLAHSLERRMTHGE